MNAEKLGEVRLLASRKNWIEGDAVRQLEKTAKWPGMVLAVGLPDLHPGKGSPIGAAFVVNGCVYPTLVGNDIGCGIGLWRSELSGNKIRPDAWAGKLLNLDGPWDGDAGAFLSARGVDAAGFEHCLGTIGGGNHFAELQIVERIQNHQTCECLGVRPDAVYLCVHSGSRGLGEAILSHHVATFAAGSLADGSEAQATYLRRHDHARQWASANRELIATRFFERLGTDGVRLMDLCHNSVEQCNFGGLSCWLHRKGAAPSTGGPVVIPGSRGAFTYLLLPTEPNERSGYSLAHGAGRKWSRSDSRERLEGRYTSKDLTRTELGSQVICEDTELLYQEAPQAYKNIHTVIDDLVREELAEVLAVLRPLVTYKVRG